MSNPLVLLIDPSATSRKIIEILLRRNGMECVTVGCAEAALRIILDAQQAMETIAWTVSFPQLILVDPDLPGMGVKAFMEQLHAVPQVTSRIAICSGRGSFLDIPMDGVSGYILKPIDDRDFIAAIQNLLKVET